MKKTLLVISLGLFLTACGSSGGGSSKNANTINSNVSNTKTKSIDLVDDALKSKIIEIKTVKLDDGTILNVADMPIGFNEKKLTEGKVRLLNGAYYAFGSWVPDNLKYEENGLPLNVDLTGQQRAASYITDINNLPKSGVITYEGESLGIATRGKLQLSVDLANKNVNGKIYDRHLDSGKSLNDIKLTNGKIVSFGDKDASFSGDASYSGIKGEFSGSFVGPKAEEVVGSVTKDGAIYVGFGGSAKK